MKVSKWFILLVTISLAGMSGCAKAPNEPAGAAGQTAENATSAGAGDPGAAKAGNGSDESGSGTVVKGFITQQALDLKPKGDASRYQEFFNMSKPGPIVAGLEQRLVPQGLAYYKDKDWMIITYYSEDKKPSVLSVTDLSTGKLVKAMELYKDGSTPYTGHAGGVAVSKNNVWVASEKSAYRIKLEDVVNAKDGDKLVFEETIPMETNASFITYADGILWVGEYARYDVKTDSSHRMRTRDKMNYSAWVAGYKLNADDTVDTGRMSEEGKAIPDYILSIPNEVQGMTVVGNRITLSQSGGRDIESRLATYEWSSDEAPHAKTEKFGSEPVPVWFLDGQNMRKLMVMPPMSEGLFERDGRMYVLFESAANMYRDGAYPLDKVYMIDTKALFGQ